jgi:hypothetical protein
MNARGNCLLVEEKERNKVNKLLPKLEKELQDLIEGELSREWCSHMTYKGVLYTLV